MDTESYDLVLYLMSDYELKTRRTTLLAAQRVERHRPDGDPLQYVNELAAIDAEIMRRETEDEDAF